jgi:hypothetical protein
MTGRQEDSARYHQLFMLWSKSRSRTSRLPLISTFVAFGMAAGCGTTRPELEESELRARRTELIHLIDREYEQGLRSMLARMEFETEQPTVPGDPRYDVLLLHGGGPAGAFAAGFLTGWEDVDEPSLTRPRFDYVTGSSSGALLAPFAYAGSSAHYARVLELFCDFPSDIFHSPNWFALWPTRSALLDSKPLARLIEREISPEMVGQVAARADEHGSLLIATTDLDLGLGRVWDLGIEAQRAQAHGRLPGEAPVRVRHEGRTLFVPCEHEANTGPLQRHHEIGILFARHTKDVLHALLLKTLYK